MCHVILSAAKGLKLRGLKSFATLRGHEENRPHDPVLVHGNLENQNANAKCRK